MGRKAESQTNPLQQPLGLLQVYLSPERPAESSCLQGRQYARFVRVQPGAAAARRRNRVRGSATRWDDQQDAVWRHKPHQFRGRLGYPAPYAGPLGDVPHGPRHPSCVSFLFARQVSLLALARPLLCSLLGFNCRSLASGVDEAGGRGIAAHPRQRRDLVWVGFRDGAS